MLKKVLVTGATGFIGTRLCERLSLFHQIPYRALVHSFTRANRIARMGAEMAGGSLDDTASLERALTGCDVVAHLAHGDDEKTMRRAKNLISALRAAKVQRVVCVSSMSVHGPDPGPECAHESTATIGHYGESYCDSKAAEEKLFRDAMQSGDFDGIILRPTIVYGPYGPFVLGVVGRASKRDFTLIDNGAGVCNAVYVDDVCEAIVKGITGRNGAGQAVFINANQAITWREFNETISRWLVPDAEFTNIASTAALKYWKSKTPTFGSNIVSFSRLLASTEFHKELGRVPMLKDSIRGMKEYLSGKLDADQKLRLKVRVQGPRRVDVRAVGPDWPTPDRILRETCRTAFSNELAQRVLEWKPEYDFAAGAALCRQWLEFAEYIPKNPS